MRKSTVTYEDEVTSIVSTLNVNEYINEPITDGKGSLTVTVFLIFPPVKKTKISDNIGVTNRVKSRTIIYVLNFRLVYILIQLRKSEFIDFSIIRLLKRCDVCVFNTILW